MSVAHSIHAPNHVPALLALLALTYLVALATRSRTITIAFGSLASAIFFPWAVLAAAVLALLSRAPGIQRFGRFVPYAILAVVAAKNTLADTYALNQTGITFVLFQFYYFFVDDDVHRSGLINTIQRLVFYPQLACGPILRPGDYTQARRRQSAKRVQYANALFLSGLVLKVWCADNLAVIFHDAEVYLAEPWLFGIYVCADFAGWCFMAAAIGQCAGIRIHRNFRFPYRARTATAFWARWNITLNQWVRTALPVHLLANRGSWGKAGYVLVMCSIMALWHGIAWGFLLFGLTNFLTVLIQRKLSNRWALGVSQVMFLYLSGLFFSSAVPNEWALLDANQAGRVALALGAFVCFEGGLAALLWKLSRNSILANRLIPAALGLAMVLRLHSPGFVYAQF